MTFDPRPFSRGGSVAIVSVSVVHIYLATLLLFQPLTANATNVRALVMGFKAIHPPGGVGFMAAILVLSALSAMVGALFKLGYVRVLTFLPQCVFLGFSAAGGQIAAWLDHYLDGTGFYPDGSAIPWQHISADQVGYAALFVVYASAILRRCWEPNS